MFVNTFFEERLANLLNLARRVEEAFTAAGLEYRVVGALAAYLYVEERKPHAGRLTKDIDIVVRPEDLPRIATAVERVGLRYVAETNRLIQAGRAENSRSVHLMLSAVARPSRRINGIRVAPLAEVVEISLTSFRLTDQLDVQDLHRTRLISSELEAGISPLLRERLAQVRASR